MVEVPKHATLTCATAEDIYERTTAQLEQESHYTQGLLQQQQVESLCTTDEPTASLEHHKTIREQGISPKVFPTFRPDKAFAIEGGKAYLQYMERRQKVLQKLLI